MLQYMRYRESISAELIAVKDRLRSIIGNSHWGEDGRYKEIILSSIMRNALPSSVSIGTGFVIGEHAISRQIDIIIYRRNVPPFFQNGDFVIVPREAVLGIVEVKTKLDSRNARETIRNAHENGCLIGPHIFNGVFSFDKGFALTDRHADALFSTLTEENGYINNIAFGKDHFMKYWDVNMPRPQCQRPHYSFYHIANLSFGYFISNLVEDIYIQENNQPILQSMQQYLYPIEGGKEARRIDALEICILR